MKFIVDAQLPRRLAMELAAAGHDVAHTLDLPLGNRTPDREIASLAANEARIVITKDSDFVTTFYHA
jgi:predicted nuclease of predicted toxin-antitoxin system